LKSPKLTKKFGYLSRNGVNTAIFSTQKCGISQGLLLSKSSRMGEHHGIDDVIKMQYMLGCLDEQEKGMRGSSKAPMSPGENHNQVHQ